METIDQGTPAPPHLQVDLTMTQEMYASLARESCALDVARSYVIDSPEMADAANTELKSIKARIAVVKKWRDGFIEPAQKIMENARALFNPGLQALEAGESHLKTLLLAYTTEQQRLAEEARREREAAERKARQEAEAAAAAERARAAEKAREQERLAEEAEGRRLKALAEGNARAAAAAAAEAAKATERAAAAVESAEQKAQETLLEAAAMVAAPVVEAPKLAGFSSRDKWGGILAPNKSEIQAIIEISKAIAAGREDLAALLEINWPAVNRLAGALHEAMNVPGLVAKNTPTAASRK